MSGRERAALWWLWFVACLAVWMLLVDTVALNEVFEGLVAAALAATLAIIVRGDLPVRGPHVPGLGRKLIVLPWRVALDSWSAIVALARRVRGRPVGSLREVPAHPGGVLEETVSTLLATVSPNTIVVEVDTRRGVALVHELIGRGGRDLDEVMERP